MSVSIRDSGGVLPITRTSLAAFQQHPDPSSWNPIDHLSAVRSMSFSATPRSFAIATGFV